MRFLIGLLILACTSLGFAATPANKSPTVLPFIGQFHRMQVDGRSRSYIVHLPPGFDPKKPTPVVLIFHGVGTNGVVVEWLCGMNKKADQAGFVAIYPNGTGLGDVVDVFNSWDGPFPRNRVDDVEFVRKLLDNLSGFMTVDAKRVYAAGMSNGGIMCYRLAAELSDRIAAIASVSGTMALDRCEPKRPVSVIDFHGTDDPIVPYNGPVTRFLKFKSVQETVQTWAWSDGCPRKPVTTQLPDLAHDGTKVKRTVWGPGTDGAEVVLYTIEGGGHAWPGREMPVRFVGKSTSNISANDLIWEFFQKHPMK